MAQQKLSSQFLAPYFVRTRGDIKPGVHRMQKLLWSLALQLNSHPDSSVGCLPLNIFSPKVRILVAGTNGKGSVCCALEAALRACGYKTGLYTSPHLVSPVERIRINGNPIEQAALEQLCLFIDKCLPHVLPDATFFEILTAAAILFFETNQTQVDIYEVGLGGRLDSTNVIPSDIGVLTSVGFDHCEILGNTLAQIGWEKAFVSRRNKPLVLGPGLTQSPAYDGILLSLSTTGAYTVSAEQEDEQVSDCLQAGKETWGMSDIFIEDITRKMPYLTPQTLATLFCTLDLLHRDLHLQIDKTSIASGLANVKWPGRFDLRILTSTQGSSYPLLFDCAHNPAGIEFFKEHYQKIAHRVFQPFDVDISRPPIVIFGSLADKQWRVSIELLLGFAGGLYFVAPNSPRAVPVAELCAAASRLKEGEQCADSHLAGQSNFAICVAFDDLRAGIKEALENAKQGRVPCVMLGSIALIGEAMELLELEPFDA